MNQQYLEVTDEAGAKLFQRNIDGPVTMLNLLRFREVADYSGFPDLAPPEPITGRAAYDRYIEHTMPFLAAAGGSIQFMGAAGPYLIGPAEDMWDLVLLVRHLSVEAFISMAQNDAFMVGHGHRMAALADARLLPITETG